MDRIESVLNIYVFLFFLFFIFHLFSEDTEIEERNWRISEREKRKKDEKLAEQLKKQDCVEFIELLSSEERSIYDKSPSVYLWTKKSPNGKRDLAGIMSLGSKALLLEVGSEEYKVQSSINNLIGWVNKGEAARTIFLNPKTFAKCDEHK
jgi:hypothetical protein